MNRGDLLAAFMSLPRGEGRWTDEMVETELDGLLAKTAILAPFSVRRAKPARGGAAAKELHRLGKAARQLIDAIDGLSRDAVEFTEVVGKVPRHPVLLRQDLEGLVLFLAEHGGEVGSSDAQGRPADDATRIIADSTLRAYEAITGRRATVTVQAIDSDHAATGPAVEFLREVFRALGVSASAGSHVRRWRGLQGT